MASPPGEYRLQPIDYDSYQFDCIHDKDSINDDAPSATSESLTYSEGSKHKKIKTLALYLTFFGQGLTAGILGPSLPDFQLQVSASLKWISFVFTARSIGSLIGTVVGGLVYDKIETSLVLCLSLLVMAIVGMIMTHVENIALLVIAMVTWGVSAGFNNTGCNTWCMKIWGDKSIPYVQALHFTFALGATVSPLITSPFLSSPDQQLSVTNNSLKLASNLPNISSDIYSVSNRQFSLPNETATVLPYRNNDGSYFTVEYASDLTYSPIYQEYENKSRGLLWVPYTIVSAYIFLVSVFFAYIHCCFVARPSNSCMYLEEKATEDDYVQTETVSREKTYRIFLIILLSVFFFVYAPLEIVYGSFLYIYAVEGNVKFTPQMASYLNSAFWGTFAAARGISVCCAVRLASKTMLTIDIFGVCFDSSLLSIFARENAVALWIGSILLGASMASLYPSALSWANLYIHVTGRVTSVFLFVTSSSMMIFPWFVGVLFDTVGVLCLMYVTSAACLFTAVTYVIMQFVASKLGKRDPHL
ncbi:sodium-dependent glucose transporter 1A-like [Glandiceps talaboti]